MVRQGCADAGETSADLHLVVRQWEDISPAAEFRCFVVEGHLIGTALTGTDWPVLCGSLCGGSRVRYDNAG